MANWLCGRFKSEHFLYNDAMNEVTLALVVLIVATLFGAFLKPNEAQTRPLSPDDIKGHTAEPDHHH